MCLLALYHHVLEKGTALQFFKSRTKTEGGGTDHLVSSNRFMGLVKN